MRLRLRPIWIWSRLALRWLLTAFALALLLLLVAHFDLDSLCVFEETMGGGFDAAVAKKVGAEDRCVVTHI